MPRLFTFTAKAKNAVTEMKRGTTKSLLSYLLSKHGIDKEVDQVDIIRDLMQVQFKNVAEGGVFAKVSSTPIVNQFSLRKPSWVKSGLLTDRTTLKVKKVPQKAVMEAMQAKIDALEAKLAKT